MLLLAPLRYFHQNMSIADGAQEKKYTAMHPLTIPTRIIIVFLAFIPVVVFFCMKLLITFLQKFASCHRIS